MRAGECASYVTEEFAFKQLFRNGRTIHFNERAVFPRTTCVDSSSDELLTNARLAFNKYGCRRFGHCFDAFQHAPKCRAGTHDAPEVQCDIDFFSQVVTLAFELVPQACVLKHGAA